MRAKMNFIVGDIGFVVCVCMVVAFPPHFPLDAARIRPSGNSPMLSKGGMKFQAGGAIAQKENALRKQPPTEGKTRRETELLRRVRRAEADRHSRPPPSS